MAEQQLVHTLSLLIPLSGHWNMSQLVLELQSVLSRSAVFVVLDIDQSEDDDDDHHGHYYHSYYNGHVVDCSGLGRGQGEERERTENITSRQD